MIAYPLCSPATATPLQPHPSTSPHLSLAQPIDPDARLLVGAIALGTFVGLITCAAAPYMSVEGVKKLPIELTLAVLSNAGLGIFLAIRLSHRISEVVYRGEDVLSEWLPAFALATISAFSSFRAISWYQGRGFLPKELLSGPFPAVVVTAVGSYTVSSLYFAALEQPGGITAWVPFAGFVVATAALCRRITLRLADTPHVSNPLFAALLGACAAAIFYGQTLAVPAAVEASKKKKGKAKAPEVVEDFVLDYLPQILLAAGMGTALVRKVVYGKPAISSKLLTGSFPWCLLVAGITFTFNTIYVESSKQEGGSFDDFLPLMGMLAVSAVVARKGANMQKA